MEESDWRPSRTAGHDSSTSKGSALPIFKAKIVMVNRLASSTAPQRQQDDEYEAMTSAVFRRGIVGLRLVDFGDLLGVHLLRS